MLSSVHKARTRTEMAHPYLDWQFKKKLNVQNGSVYINCIDHMSVLIKNPLLGSCFNNKEWDRTVIFLPTQEIIVRNDMLICCISVTLIIWDQLDAGIVGMTSPTEE